MSGQAQISDVAEGVCALNGPLTFGSCASIWRQLQVGGALRSACSVNLAEVAAADSAGLALLLAWRASRIAAGGDLRFDDVPQRLQLLARLSGAEGLLTD
jgi:ABC-type transporter Mla MlaB component